MAEQIPDSWEEMTRELAVLRDQASDQPTVIIHGVAADGDQCEVCGQWLTRLHFKQVELPDGTIDIEPTGPWYESREHQRGNAIHDWWQEHNCIKPKPDECPFCEQAQRLGYDPMAPKGHPINP
jgi:hypothetical protein